MSQESDEEMETETDAPEDDEAPPNDAESPDTAPEVELGLYQINVRVKGSADDDLAAVEESARGLVEHLVDQAKHLEDEPDGRGLG
ncbi:hypothetical protein [Halobaculum sp. MBLA0143]|uniref:hypothetical protein n=1 Tax=Halobaculum sp. MBLA0143 TaxID=3079933 RepID=UPI003523D844